MQFTGISTVGVLIATVASYAFGAGYYMTLAKPWMAALGKTEADMRGARSPVPFIVAFVAQLVMAGMLAGLLGHRGELTIVNGLISGFFVWLGFVLPAMVVNHGFQGTKRSLTVIDGAHWLGVLLVQGLVLGLIGA